jgi:hypothetical protein
VCAGTQVATTTVESKGENPPFEGEGTSEAEHEYNTVTTTTTKWLEDCTTDVETKCSGSATSSSNTVYTSEGESIACGEHNCSSTYAEDCTWSGTYTFTPLSFGCNGESISFAIDGPCPLDGSVITHSKNETVYDPPITCTINNTFSGVNEKGICSPPTLPSYPGFIDCTPEGEEPPEPPELQPGQGYGSEAYKFTNPNNPQIKSEQNVRYRVEHGPTGTCYLKVWFRKVIQQYKYEDCDTGFPGDPPRTFEWQVECEDLSGGDPEVPATPQCPNDNPVNQEQPEIYNEGPQVCITGPNPIPVNVTRTYTEYGATAFGIIAPEVPPDPQTGEGGSPAEYGCLPVETDGDVDTSTCGTQYVTYSATDATGKETKVFRTVIVQSASLNPCASRWSTAGEATYQDIPGPYEWVGSGYPCFEDNDKVPEACENKIVSQEYNVTAGLNQSVTIEYKYSFVKDYEPNWPDEYGCVGCKPNGFPTVPITTACSICEPTSCTHCLIV